MARRQGYYAKPYATFTCRIYITARLPLLIGFGFKKYPETFSFQAKLVLGLIKSHLHFQFEY